MDFKSIEVYLADNECDKLCSYLGDMAWENISYDEIISLMIKELGNPVRQYSKLDYNKLSYNNINEFFLDDFTDLKE